ncbi:MAG TPA: hypothetical protein VFQ65_11515 [Kofleriaceae bacterium]|nr:hypothetical protein [Kofleriaceae bacterium]
MRWKPYIGSVAVHALLIGIALHAGGAAPAEDPVQEQPAVELIDVSVAPAADVGGGGGGAAVGMALPEPAHRAASVEPSAREPGVLTGIDVGDDNGTASGSGIGDGTGNGIGDGIGNGIGTGIGARLDPRAELRQLPAPPPPPVSKARPAELLHPTRQTEVDEAELFAARITVDETGDVVGAHMTQSHPGSRGEVASSMIWQFRYAPALDDDGVPVRSTFVQTFAVR